MTSSYQNPILPGFYPDPSCILVGDTFYLANSSFQFFPGIPIHKSKDLVNWKHIGNALCRPEQLRLDAATTKINNAAKGEIFTGGIYAPTLRHHNGIFYIVCTMLTGSTDMPPNVDFQPRNFIITAKDLEDPMSFSDPIYFDFYGIDPSLFFEDDGRVYVQGSWIHGYDKNPATVIRQAEIDLETGQLLSEARDIWSGFSGKVPEGPHIYKKDGYYYLLAAEGGTHRRHMITMSRSKDIWGPYESSSNNPVLTTAGPEACVQCVGHGDLFQDLAGSWWVVMLARREYVNHTSFPLGRETFMAPVEWPEGEFPSCASVEILQALDRPMEQKETLSGQPVPVTLSSLSTLYLRSPDLSNYSAVGETISLKPTDTTLAAQAGAVTFVGQRQVSLDSIASVSLVLDGLWSGGSISGLTIYKDPFRYVAFEYTSSTSQLSLKLQAAGEPLTTIQSCYIENASSLQLSIRSSTEAYIFQYSQTDRKTGPTEMNTMGEVQSSLLSGDDFTGTVYAIYASGRGGPVRFRQFNLQQ
ncbi:hypothetical protein FE257_011220 [Aspergillus nanangensis]|uniref:Beta-xylosidase C-terminal Concanavalin A-like domain-containing protein n=1 Tax=Aspergillus nanangensis TaxID=2582783 RepID=A0AAD4GRM6_ASPNN|nr:hypothetical protein FE257_011220 [Aspergillus nanangensis]